MKKLLIHTIAFSPDGVSTAYIYNEIAIKFIEAGYSVIVLTTTPHFNPVIEHLNKQLLTRKFGGLFYTSRYHDINVIHVPQKKFKSTILRVIGFVYWHVVSFFLAIKVGKVDLILSPSPPLTIGLINIAIGKLYHAKVIYNVQEIYPDLLIEGQNLKNQWLIKILKRLEEYVYDKSHAITTIDQVFYDTIIKRFMDESKLNIIPNFVNTDVYKPLVVVPTNLDRKYFPNNNNLKVMFAGNIGFAQDWELLIAVASKLDGQEISFYVIGDGVQKDYLIAEINKNDIKNIHLIPYQDRSLMPSIIAYSDLQFILMSPKTDGHGFPSKIYTIMACGKPMIVSSGANTPIVKFLEDHDCSFIIKQDNYDGKVTEIVSILGDIDKKLLFNYGKNAQSVILAKYSNQVVPQQYVQLANSLFK